MRVTRVTLVTVVMRGARLHGEKVIEPGRSIDFKFYLCKNNIPLIKSWKSWSVVIYLALSAMSFPTLGTF